MKAFIFAAGKGVRLRPLTENTPKPMLKVGGVPLLEHILGILPEEISEIFIVVGYLGEQIKEYFGDSWQGRQIRYIEQAEQLGTGYTLMQCRKHLEDGERFLVLYADDLRDKESLELALEHEYAILVKTLEDTGRFGTVVTDEAGVILGLEEKSPNPKSHSVVTGAYVLTTKIFDYPPSLEPNGEYYINSMLIELFKVVSVYAEEQKFWLPVGHPEDIELAEEALRAKGGKLGN
jgi:UDP-N-acetylglucosamine diphosphorylase / glucose-1-phosphate thymidylyltransferase / UDP-N-acetylgalactosamine diphosphorylase / glucosamine-1-phosphate N-acetyltransferase / galactosamine-1-phosphate N-acetyltransferase